VPDFDPHNIVNFIITLAVNDLEKLLKAFSLMIKLNGLTTHFMFLVIFHRRFLPPQVFLRRVSGLQEVHDVMT